MATLKEAINTARSEPTSERALKLKAAILSGKMDKVAQAEGIDLGKFKTKFGTSVAEGGTTAPALPEFLQKAGGTIAEQAVESPLKERGISASQAPSLPEAPESPAGGPETEDKRGGFLREGTLQGGIARKVEDVAEDTLETAKGGLQQIGTGLKQSVGLEKQEAVGEGFTNVIQGGLQTIFSPAAGLLQNVPGGEKIAQLASLPAEAVGKIYDVAAEAAGVDLNSPEYAEAREQIITAFDVGSLALGPKAIRTVKGKVQPKVAGAKAATKQALETSAQADVAKVLAPTKISTKRTTQKILPEVTAQIKPTLSLKRLKQKTSTKLDAVRDKFAAFEESGGVKGSTKKADIIDFMEQQKSEFTVDGAVVEPRAVKAIEGVQEVINALPDNVPNTTVRSIRQIWDQTIKESNGFTRDLKEGSEIAIKKATTDFLREKLAESNPKLAEINKEFSALKKLETVLTETIERKTGQTGGLRKGLGATAGATIGSVLGPQAAAAGALAGSKLASLMNSTFWRTVSASTKNRLAKALAEGDAPVAIKTVERLHKQAVKEGLISVTPAIATATSEAAEETE